jgi:hypothetical protein
VDFLRLELERRPRSNLRPIEDVAVRRRPQAGVLPRRRQVLVAKDGEEGRVGGIDVLPNCFANELAIGFRRDLDHRGNDRLLNRYLEQPV